MLKLNGNYSDYTDETDENYPEGKAINASSSESFDGTPLLAEFMNDVNAAHIAMYEKAYGNTTGIDGNPDTQKNSQFADAVSKYTDDKMKSHADERGLADGVHGATVEATPGQICTRDELGNVKVGTAVEDGDAINKSVFDNIVNDIMRFIVPVGSVKMYTGVNEPKYYLICDGRAVSRSTYSALYGVIGTTYGAGDGSTTFNLPDFRECSPIGIGQRASGVTTHNVLTLGQFQDDQFASHSHTTNSISKTSTDETDTNHTHIFKTSGSTTQNDSTGASRTGAYDQGFSFKSRNNELHLTMSNDFYGGAYGSNAGTGIRVSYGTDSAGGMYGTANIRVQDHTHSGTTNWQSDSNTNYKHSHGFNHTHGTDSKGSTTGGTHGKQLGVNFIIKY